MLLFSLLKLGTFTINVPCFGPFVLWFKIFMIYINSSPGWNNSFLYLLNVLTQFCNYVAYFIDNKTSDVLCYLILNLDQRSFTFTIIFTMFVKKEKIKVKLLEMHAVCKFTFLPRLIIYSKNMISIQFDNRAFKLILMLWKYFLKVLFSTI